MSVDRRISSRFERSETQARNTARVQLDTILANADHLLKVRSGDVKLKAARDFDAMAKRGESFSPGQYSYIDALYESMWKGMGMESMNTHHDKPRGNLRHPK